MAVKELLQPAMRRCRAPQRVNRARMGLLLEFLHLEYLSTCMTSQSPTRLHIRRLGMLLTVAVTVTVQYVLPECPYPYR